MRKLVYIKIDDSFLAASINYLFIFFSLQLLQAGIRFKVSTANSGYFSFGNICSIVPDSFKVQYGQRLLYVWGF